jgi:hypothetical protein
MDEAKSTSGTRLTSPAPVADTPDSTPLSPIKVFVGLVVLLIVAGTIAYVTKPEANVQNSKAGLPESNNFALTDAEAIARFKELDAIRLRAFQDRDPSVIPNYVTSDSPLTSNLYADIDKLLVKKVVFDPNLTTKDLVVRSNTSDRIVIRQQAIEAPIFRSEKGEILSKDRARLALTVEWVLEREDSAWKIYESTVVSSQRLDD